MTDLAALLVAGAGAVGGLGQGLGLLLLQSHGCWFVMGFLRLREEPGLEPAEEDEDAPAEQGQKQQARCAWGRPCVWAQFRPRSPTSFPTPLVHPAAINKRALWLCCIPCAARPAGDAALLFCCAVCSSSASRFLFGMGWLVRPSSCCKDPWPDRPPMGFIVGGPPFSFDAALGPGTRSTGSRTSWRNGEQAARLHRLACTVLYACSLLARCSLLQAVSHPTQNPTCTHARNLSHLSRALFPAEMRPED